MISQNSKWCHYVTRLLAKARASLEYKMTSAGAAMWLPDTERFFMELSIMITKVQKKRNATATQFRFFRVLCSQNGRIRKNFKCSNYENRRIRRARNLLNQQLTPITWHFERATGSLRGNCRKIREGYWFALQRSYKIPFLHAKYSNKTT